MSFKILPSQTMLGFLDSMTLAELPTWTGVIRQSGWGTADLEAVPLAEIDDHELGVSQQGHGAQEKAESYVTSSLQPLGSMLPFQAFQEKHS